MFFPYILSDLGKISQKRSKTVNRPILARSHSQLMTCRQCHFLTSRSRNGTQHILNCWSVWQIMRSQAGLIPAPSGSARPNYYLLKNRLLSSLHLDVFSLLHSTYFDFLCVPPALFVSCKSKHASNEKKKKGFIPKNILKRFWHFATRWHVPQEWIGSGAEFTPAASFSLKLCNFLQSIMCFWDHKIVWPSLLSFFYRN